jgi:hypothetical protein
VVDSGGELICWEPPLDRRLFAHIQARASATEERRGGAEPLRFYEHVVARNRRMALMQRLFDATFWPRLFGGRHTSRDTEATLVASGFTLETRERWSFRPPLLATPVAPRILGRARRGAAQPGR